MLKRFFQKQSDKEQSLDVRLDGILANVYACFYIAADDGKDTVVNRHLQARADELERQADRLKRRADRLYGNE